jgi:hypothetical protein
MRSGVAPATLLLLALGLALTTVPSRNRLSSLLALITTIVAFAFLPAPHAWLEGIFFGCWISVIATAAMVHLRHGLGARGALALSLNAGAWAAATVVQSGSRLDVLMVLPAVLIFLPACSVVARHGSIPVRVLSSWIIAIAVLAATLQCLPVTPGYLPDHTE